ncbi:MAG: hypothetical protein RL215_2416, partial [Planctomycetota bacterium]
MRPSRAQRLLARSRFAERLEQRLMLTLNVGLSAGNLMIEETSSAADELKLDYDAVGNDYIISDPTRTLTTNISGASGSGTNQIRVPAQKVNGDLVQVLTGDGNDKITVASGFGPGSGIALVIEAGAGSDAVFWHSGSQLASLAITAESAQIASTLVSTTGNQTWSTAAVLMQSVELKGANISLQGAEGSSGNFQISASGLVTVSGKTVMAGSGTILISGNGGLLLSAGSEVSTDQGSITLAGLLSQGTADNVSGVRIQNAAVKSLGGHITISGETTSAGSGVSAIELQGAQLSTQGSGTIVIAGHAHAAAAAWGVRMLNGTQRTSLKSHDGEIKITATGGGSGGQPGTQISGALIRTEGAGNINISGESRGTEIGVLADDSSSIEASGTGSVSFTGTGSDPLQNTIDFAEMTGRTTPPYFENGFRFDSNADFDNNAAQGLVGSYADTGFVDVTATDGRAFNVHSIDVSERNGSIGPRTITFTGFLRTGGTVEHTFTTDSKFEPEVVSLTGFSNLSKFRFTINFTTWDNLKFSYATDGQVAFGDATLRSASGSISFNSNRVKLQQQLTVDIGGTVLWSQEFTGSGSIARTGTGTLILSGNSSNTGRALVKQGEFRVTGSVVSAIAVESQGNVSGTGSILGTLEVLSGGFLKPGGVPGILSTGEVQLQAGGVLSMDVGGTSPGAVSGRHDQLNVAGTVILAGSLELNLIDGYSPGIGDTLLLISNDGTDAVTGTFAGLAQDGLFGSGGALWQVSYKGGSGNDVTVTCLGRQFAVANLNASGVGSLHQAIVDANVATGAAEIIFTVAGLIEIAESHPLPAISNKLLINATSAPGYAGSPVIEVSGAVAGANFGFVFSAGSAG